MPLDTPHARQLLNEFRLSELFIHELGWDRNDTEFSVEVGGATYQIKAVAHKRGVSILECQNHEIPSYPLRQKIERQARKHAHEHLIIFTDSAKTEQIWQWVARQQGQPTAYREYKFYKDPSADALLHRLGGIAFSIDDEEGLDITGVTRSLRDQFDREKVTKRFYDLFRKEHDAFMKFLGGIPVESDQRWYASIMLNRLMFIYFIQAKSFLNNDRDYLRSKLAESKERGSDKYYKGFLCPLFFKGFAERERSEQTRQLLGDVPYLNGGIFLEHQLEKAHGRNIHIPDSAFERLFEFFDHYRWYLDERPLRDQNEINPDILGYIFEKYINQKQMGAYYTKEDITEYISKNTVIPYLFDQARKRCKIAFEGEHSIWNYLRDDPDTYIYPAVKKGVNQPLPEDIAAGINDVTKRTGWNKLAPEQYGLPTEIWREVVARRQRYEEVRARMEAGEITDVNDLITYNLNIRQFAQDVIQYSEGPELIRAFWKALQEISVLDPTCGSGAFLFAALNILEPLYIACLERMEGFLDELSRSGAKHRPERFKDFREILDRIEEHPNRRYFVLKSIIIRNLYGVDIMEEAVEICKLRLFLKLVAQIDKDNKKPNWGVEPLPDVDFNIRAGNTLVGYATLEQAEKAVTSKLDFDNAWEKIQQRAADLHQAFDSFRKSQLEMGGHVPEEHKQDLVARRQALNDELNGYLAQDYGVRPNNRKQLAKWLVSHKPFHWFVEFYGIMIEGGFHCIIGNPPYVRLRDVSHRIQESQFDSIGANNLYSLVVERALLLTMLNGRFGMITPVSIVSGPRFAPLARKLFSSLSWVASFSNRPGKLFAGVEQRLSIVLAKANRGCVHSSDYQHWYEEERAVLLERITYTASQLMAGLRMPMKTGSRYSVSIAERLYTAVKDLRPFAGSSSACWYHDGPTYWIRALPFEPVGNQSTRSNHFHRLSTPDSRMARALACIMASSTFYFHFKITSNCRDLSTRDIESFRIPLSLLEQSTLARLAALGVQMEALLRDTAKRCSRRYPSGIVEYDEYYPQSAKPMLDLVDRLLAKHYGFTDEELDFIINYDIKYRMGLDNLQQQETNQ